MATWMISKYQVSVEVKTSEYANVGKKYQSTWSVLFGTGPKSLLLR